MAKKRMFSLDVVDTDAFLDMPHSTQALYFHFSMRADDDGFVASPKRIQSMLGLSGDDLKILISKGYIIPFESGIIVIKHWRMNNYIQKDRYTETRYKDEKKQLSEAENGEYEVVDTKWIQNGYKMDTQVRLGKERKGKDSTEKKGRPYTEDFNDFWSVYPRKVGKGEAFKSWGKLKVGSRLKEEILAAVRKQKESSQWKKESGRYIPNPSTWLNQRRWEDELEVITSYKEY